MVSNIKILFGTSMPFEFTYIHLVKYSYPKKIYFEELGYFSKIG